MLLGSPSTPPSTEHVAHELNMSSMALRHRLAAEGTLFRELLDEVRQRLAEELLVIGRVTVAETAQARLPRTIQLLPSISPLERCGRRAYRALSNG